MTDNKNKTIVFDTQISHDSHIDDKQVSPWIKQNNQRVSPLNSPRKIVNNEILRNLPFAERSPLFVTQQFLKRRRYNKNTISQDFRSRAESKFKELIRKTLAQKRSIQLNSRMNRTANLVKIDLEYQQEDNFKVKPLLRSLESRPSKFSTQQKFNIRKSKKAPNLSQSKLSVSKQSKRYDVLKTQQMFYKTLQLNLPIPIKNIRRIPQIATSPQNRSSPSKSMSFPVRPKFKIIKVDREQKEEDGIGYNIMGSGINLKEKKIQNSSKRDKIRSHHQKQRKNQIQKVFLT